MAGRQEALCIMSLRVTFGRPLGAVVLVTKPGKDILRRNYNCGILASKETDLVNLIQIGSVIGENKNAAARV